VAYAVGQMDAGEINAQDCREPAGGGDEGPHRAQGRWSDGLPRSQIPL